MVIPSAFQPESLKKATTSPIHHQQPSEPHSSTATTQPEAEPGSSHHPHIPHLHHHPNPDPEKVINERIRHETADSQSQVQGQDTVGSSGKERVSSLSAFFKRDKTDHHKTFDRSTQAEANADGSKSPVTGSGGGGPYLFGLFKALASSRDDSDSSDEEIDTEATAGQRRQDQDDRHRQEQNARTGTGSKGGSLDSQGEWVPAVRAASTIQTGGTATAEDKVIVPSFYRTPSVAQDDLSHRLAVLSVNNFSGLHGHDDRVRVGEEEIQRQVEVVGQRDSRHAFITRDARNPAEAEHQEQIAEDLREEAREELTEKKQQVVERRRSEIKESLIHDDEETLRSKLVPSDIATRHDDDIIPAGMSAGEASEIRRQSEVSQYTVRDEERLRREERARERYATEPATDDESTQVGDDEQREKVTAEEKLYAICEEFGDLAGLMEGNEPETFIAESRGALFRGIIIVVRKAMRRIQKLDWANGILLYCYREIFI